MDPIVSYMLIGIAAVVLTAFLLWFRSEGYDVLVKRLYEKYKVFIIASGEFIKQQDEKLYNELIEFEKALGDAIADDEITRDELITLYKEGKDVYDRAKEIIKKNKKK